MIQAAASLALIALVYGVQLKSRRAAMGVVWLLWLLIPFLRRLFRTVDPLPLQGDPLVLIPFAATLLIGLLEFRRVGLSSRGRSVVMVFGVGMLLGVPAGILADFKWFAYSSFAYASCLAAVVIGYSERKDGAQAPQLARVLLVAMPAVAIYGIYQYFSGLPPWDAEWLSSINSFDLGLAAPGAPGHWRVFSTLQHPDTLAAMLAAAIVFVLAAKRVTAARWLALLLVAIALGLTYVRGAWIALLVALLVYALVVRGVAVLRLATVLAVCVVVGVFGSGVDPTVRAVTQRATTIADEVRIRLAPANPGQEPLAPANPGQEPLAPANSVHERPAPDPVRSPPDGPDALARISVEERVDTAHEVLSTAMDRPLGHGIGQPGRGQDFDNGYLLLIYQLGPVGALLVVAAIGYLLVLAARVVRAGRARETPAALLAIIVLTIGLEVTTNALYGVLGAVFWYSAGWVLRLAEESGSEKAPQPGPGSEFVRLLADHAGEPPQPVGRDQLPTGLPGRGG